MTRRYTRWHLHPHDDVAIQRLAATTRISPVVAQLLINRGIRDAATASRFLDPKLSDLYEPHRLPGVREAAERIVRAIAEKRSLCIYGDYDVDGITGTAILLRLLTKLGAQVQYHIPLRSIDGYGLNREQLERLANDGVSMVISVDCGITSIAEAEWARQRGIELIITDHHEMRMNLDRPLLPEAAAVVHPRLPAESPYPFGHLSGAAVAFKLAWAIAQRACGSSRVTPELRELLLDSLGLAALGIIADVVPLMDENRIFVRHGLERISKHPSEGLAALMAVCEKESPSEKKTLTVNDISYQIAPHLNAAGRLGCARLAVELLTTTSAQKAQSIAHHLGRQNQERKARERAYTEEAKALIDQNYANDPAIVVASKNWHPGVIGIVASRLMDHYGKPALVIAITDDGSVAQGSGRSMPGIELHHALTACETFLESHGGHGAAAGFKIRPERIEAFRNCFNAYVSKQLRTISLGHTLAIDAEIPLAAITLNLVKELNKLEPYGAGNAEPILLATGVRIEFLRTIGKEEPRRHVSFYVRQGQTQQACVAWNMLERFEELNNPAGHYAVAFTPRIEEWNGNRKVKLFVKDFQASGQGNKMTNEGIK